MSDLLEVTLEDLVRATVAGSFMHTSPEFHIDLVAQGLVEINPTMVDENGDIATRATQAGITHIQTSSAPAHKVVKPEVETPVEKKVPPKSSGRGRKKAQPVAETVEIEGDGTGIALPEIPVADGSNVSAFDAEEVDMPVREYNPGFEADVSNMVVTREQPAVVGVEKGFKIEAGIPLPTIKGRGRATSIYPFESLEPGQSFFVPNTEAMPKAAKSLGSTVSAVNSRNKKAGVAKHFIIRSVEGGARVWRA